MRAGMERAADARHQLFRILQIIGVDQHDEPSICLEPPAARHVGAKLLHIAVIVALILEEHTFSGEREICAVVVSAARRDG